jgi:hypothetical protein
MSEVEDQLLIHHFLYPLASVQRVNDNEEMARLNYIASRIRAALTKWGSFEEGSQLWWWTGLRNELVTYILKFSDEAQLRPHVKVGCCNGTCRTRCCGYERLP